MTEAAPLFDAVFEGQPPQQFITLQDAMNWVEDLDRPTGTNGSVGSVPQNVAA